MKLSECTKPGRILLYDGETVGVQYVLRKIFNGEKLPSIKLCSNQEQLDDAIQAALKSVYQDAQAGIEKESYSLGNLDTVFVDIDIEKKDIRQVDENGYEFELVQ